MAENSPNRPTVPADSGGPSCRVRPRGEQGAASSYLRILSSDIAGSVIGCSQAQDAAGEGRKLPRREAVQRVEEAIGHQGSLLVRRVATIAIPGCDPMRGP